MTESTVSDFHSPDSILNLDDLKSILGSKWVDGEDERIARFLERATAVLRAKFKNDGRNLYEEIALGNVERIIVEDIISTMVSRAIDEEFSEETIPEGASQVSRSVGDYSESFSFLANSGGNPYYLRKDEERLLGLNKSKIISISLIGRRDER